MQLPHHGILLIRIEEADYKVALVANAIIQYYDKLLNIFSVINKLRLESKNNQASLFDQDLSSLNLPNVIAKYGAILFVVGGKIWVLSLSQL